MDDETPLEPPTPTWKDHAHRAGLATADAATYGVGGLMLSMVFGTPLGHRRQEFDREVSARIEALEQQGRAHRDKLLENEQFISTYVDATLAAIKTHNESKREALRNAIINAALPDAPDETRQSLFVRWVDELTELHLRVLEYCRGKRRYPRHLADAVKRQFPESQSQHLSEVIVNELVARNLVRPDPASSTVVYEKEEVRCTTLGSAFLSFIRDPLTAESGGIDQ